MSTRAGTVYQSSGEVNGAMEVEYGDNPGVAESTSVERMWIGEQRRREAEWAEERHQWEVELKLREQAYEEERRRREEEWQQREEHNRRQMEVLQSLVVGIQLQGEVANRRAEREKDAKIAKLTEEDDIVAYLTMFERIMTAYEIKKECWAFKLAANLVGRAQQAYAALSSVDAASYEKLKAAILQRYDITEESYRQRFRSVRKKTGESIGS